MKETMTVADAIVRTLIAEGIEAVLGIFGHGNVVLGEALYEHRDKIRYIPVKNEQNAVHLAVAYARLSGRPLAVTTSVGPGATNLVTGAAQACVNRLPVLLLPGEVFAGGVGPVLQQVESPTDATANDCLRPVARYFSRITRPEQVRRRLREAFDAMLCPGEMGPAVLALPMDVQAQAYAYDTDLLLAERDRESGRVGPDRDQVLRAVELIAGARRPFIVAGGGTYYSRCWDTLVDLAEMIGAPVATTQSGTGMILDDHALCVNGLGPCGSQAANRLARRADLVIGVGTRYSDFTTSSETQFAPGAKFLNINLSSFDVAKQNALRLWGDARVTVHALIQALGARGLPRLGRGTGAEYTAKTPWFGEVRRERESWRKERERWLSMNGSPLAQSRAIGIINDCVGSGGTITAAAGSLPGDLQRLWRSSDPERKGYYCEYGYSTMGFEIPGAMGAKLALPDRHVVALVGDMSFLMAPQEIATAVQIGMPITIVVFDNHGGQSIRHLQRRSGFADFGMEHHVGSSDAMLKLDFARIAEGMGAVGLHARSAPELERALERAQGVTDRPTVIHLAVDKDNLMGGYEGWWDVPLPETWARGERKGLLAAYRKAKDRQIVR